MSADPILARQRTCAIVLPTLVAEGTPRLAAGLVREWLRGGSIRPVVVVLTAAHDEMRREFEALGIPIVDLNLSLGGSGYRRYLELAAGLYRAVKAHQVDAVLSMPFGWHAIIGLGAKLAGAKVVVAHVGNSPAGLHGDQLTKFRLLVQLGRCVTDYLACCSAYVRDTACATFGLPTKRARVVYNGAPLEEIGRRAALARESSPRGERAVISMVARLEQHKDQPTLIEAAGLLRDAGREIEVRLIGSGSRREEFAREIARRGLQETVLLMGSRSDVPELLGASDLFVFSTTADEGQGIALVEAMAARVPIVASNVGACVEVLEDGRCGLLFEAGDAQSLARTISEVLDAPEAASDRAGHAFARAAALFSVEASADAYERLLFGERQTR